jgi:hypothetical protein
METIRFYLEPVACFSFLIPLIPGWILYRRLPSVWRLLVLTLTIEFLCTATGYFTGLYYISNLWLYFLLYCLQFYLYSVIFRKLLSSRFARQLIRALMVLFVGLIIYHFLWILPQRTLFDSYTPAFLSLAVLLYCVLYFHQQLDSPNVTFIYKTPWFWVVTGLLMYFSGGFLILLFTSTLMFKELPLIRELWNLQDLLLAIKNLLVSVGFLYVKKTAWTKSSFWA